MALATASLEPTLQEAINSCGPLLALFIFGFEFKARIQPENGAFRPVYTVFKGISVREYHRLYTY
jgi:hypothetical protein